MSRYHLTSLQFNRVFTTDIRKHTLVVFLAAIIGYLAGITLNALSATVEFRYIGALCLCGASWSSAFGTWLLSDFCDDVPVAEPGALEESTNWKLYSQKFVGYGATQSALIARGSDDISRLLKETGGIKIAYDDGTTISTGIDRTLAVASQNFTNPVIEALSNGQGILQKTIDQWEAGYSEIIVVRREAFDRLGIGNCFAVGVSEDGYLKVYIGMPALRGQSKDFAISEEITLIEV